ncbi:MAG: hypothetical protein GXP62_18845, partial [Oligoflexia bacterium]|nr:hypothetical protein [Oligoflexia bacterium]
MSPLGPTAADPSLGPPRGARLDVLFIANRGEIAVRIARTAQDRGLFVVMAFTAEDRGAVHTRQGDLAVLVPDYLDGPALVAAAKQAGAQPT